MIIVAPGKEHPYNALYEIRYKVNGTRYSFHFEKMITKFHATEEQVLNAIAFGESTIDTPIPDGPMKGMFIRTMTKEEHQLIADSYKMKKNREFQNELKFVIGTQTPESIW